MSNWRMFEGEVSDSDRLGSENMPIGASEEHSIGKHHQVAFDHTCHSLGHVVSEIKPFLVDKSIEHLNETNIKMILIPHETNSIFTKNGFLLFEVKLHFREHHLISVRNNSFALNSAAFSGRPLIENGITYYLGIFNGGK
ncbi:hypothetical protein Tco_1052765 [Tanacetum coccineum]